MIHFSIIFNNSQISCLIASTVRGFLASHNASLILVPYRNSCEPPTGRVGKLFFGMCLPIFAKPR